MQVGVCPVAVEVVAEVVVVAAESVVVELAFVVVELCGSSWEVAAALAGEFGGVSGGLVARGDGAVCHGLGAS